MKLGLLFPAIVLVACSGGATVPPVAPSPPYHETDRDGLDTPLGRACERLRELGCDEGLPNRHGRTCFEALSSASELAVVPTDCLIAASSRQAVRACGDANTIRVRCATQRSSDDRPATLVRSEINAADAARKPPAHRSGDL